MDTDDLEEAVAEMIERLDVSGLTDHLSEIFEASDQAVTYRLQTFGFLPDSRRRRGGKR
jgi:hypothetical protein